MKMEYYDSMGLLFESILEAWTNRFLNRSNPPSRFGGDSEQISSPDRRLGTARRFGAVVLHSCFFGGGGRGHSCN